MALTVDQKKQQRQQMSAGITQRPTPQIPKIPEQVKNRFPELREGWEQYEKDWEKFFKETGTIAQ